MNERFNLAPHVNVPSAMPADDDILTMLALWRSDDTDTKAAALDLADRNRIAAQRMRFADPDFIEHGRTKI